MVSDLPDVELYHQELLRNIDLRRTMKSMRKKRHSASLREIEPVRDENEDAEFAKDYIQGCGFPSQR